MEKKKDKEKETSRLMKMQTRGGWGVNSYQTSLSNMRLAVYAGNVLSF